MRNSTTFYVIILSGIATLFTTGCSHTSNMVSKNLKLPVQESPQMIMARTAEHKGQFAKAEQTYRVMLQKNSQNATVLNRMGIVSSKMGKHDSAVKYLMEAVKIQPDNSKFLTDLGYSLYLQNDLTAAEIALEESIKRDPSSKRSYNNLSLVLGHQGRMDEAYQVARSVLSADEAHANIGYICLQRGMLEEASQHYQKSLEMNPEQDSVKEAIVQVAQLQKKQLESQQPELEIAQSSEIESEEVEQTVQTEEPLFQIISDGEVVNPETIEAVDLPVAQISAVEELPIQGFEPPVSITNDDYIPAESNEFFNSVQSVESVTNVRSVE